MRGFVSPEQELVRLLRSGIRSSLVCIASYRDRQEEFSVDHEGTLEGMDQLWKNGRASLSLTAQRLKLRVYFPGSDRRGSLRVLK